MNTLVKRAESLAPLLGRVFLAAIFLWSGTGKIPGWTHTEGYMAMHNMFWIPLFLAGAVVVEVIGGLALLAGYQARLAALVVALYLVPATLIFHNFWSVPADQVLMQTIQFMKNVSIIGGLLMVTRFGAGEFSIDNMLAKRKSREEAPALRKAA